MNRIAVLVVALVVAGAGYALFQYTRDGGLDDLKGVNVEADDVQADAPRRKAVIPEADNQNEAASDPASDGNVVEEDGTNVVRGRLLDPAGNPIGGETVTLRGPSPGGAFVSLGGRRKKAKSTQTDENGEFVFEGVEHGAQRIVTVWPADYKRIRSEFDFLEGEVHDLGDLIAERGAVLSGRVLNAASVPVANAKVSVSVTNAGPGVFVEIVGGEYRNGRVVYTDEDGVFRAAGLENGSANIVVRADGFPPKSGVKVDVSDEEPVEGFEIQLANGREIFGTVTDARGAPVKGAMVAYQPTSGFNPAWYGRNRPTVTTDDQGKFAIRGAPTDSVKLTVTQHGFMKVSDHVVRAEENSTVVELALSPQVWGLLVDAATKKPISEFTVKAESFGGWSEPQRIGAKTHRGSEAARALGHEAADNFFALTGITGKRVQFRVEAPGYAPLYFSETGLAANEKRGIVAEAVSEIPFAGIVLDDEGNPVKRARLIMTPVSRSDDGRSVAVDEMIIEASSSIADMPMVTRGRRSRHAYSESDGTFAFKGLTPGEYKLSATHSEFVDNKGTDVVLETGKPVIDYEIRMSPGATLSGFVFDQDGNPVVGADVSLKQKTEGSTSSNAREFVMMDVGSPASYGPASSSRTKAKKDGSYALKGIAPGEYTVSAKRPRKNDDIGGMILVMGDSSKDSSDGVPVTLTAGVQQKLDLRLKRRARVYGRILAGGTPVRGAAVTAGQGGGGLVLGGKKGLPDARGQWELADLAPGKHTFTLSVKGSPYTHKETVELSEGQQYKLDFNLPTGTIRGRVLDSEGNPVVGATVRAKPVKKEKSNKELEEERVQQAFSLVMVSDDSGGEEMVSYTSSGGMTTSTKTDESGYYEVPYLAGGTYNLSARKSGYSTGKRDGVELGEGASAKGADINLAAACALTVRADYKGDTGGSWGQVKVSRVGDENNTSTKMFPIHGEAKFTTLKPGDYLIECTIKGEKKEERVSLEIGSPQTITIDF